MLSRESQESEATSDAYLTLTENTRFGAVVKQLGEYRRYWESVRA